MKAINNLVHLVWGMVTGILAVVSAVETLGVCVLLADKGAREETFNYWDKMMDM